MAERVSPAVRVRAVRGRVIDPFRGTLEDDADRFASRAVDSQPIDDVIAAMEKVPGVKVTRAGRRFTLGRGHDVMKVSFASAARRVSLDDATFEGDGHLVIAVAQALLPLFGAVEVRIGSYSDLIDGHEPFATVFERYDAWWIAESLKLAKKLADRDAASRPAPSAARAAPNHVPAYTVPAPRRGIPWLRAGFAAVLVALVGSLAIGTCIANRKADVGAYCTKNDDCDSEKCLPREPVKSFSAYGVDFGSYSKPPPPSDPSGACTKQCYAESDCPADMTCGEVMSYGSLGFGTRTSSCMPRAWL